MTRRQRIAEWFADRLREASTWRGIILLVASTGGITMFEPDPVELLTFCALFIAGMIGVMFPDKRGRK